MTPAVDRLDARNSRQCCTDGSRVGFDGGQRKGAPRPCTLRSETSPADEHPGPQVNAALSDEARESQSVGALRDQLADIEAEVEAASSRLALTKARVAQNLQRVDQLKDEAVGVPSHPALLPILQPNELDKEILRGRLTKSTGYATVSGLHLVLSSHCSVNCWHTRLQLRRVKGTVTCAASADYLATSTSLRSIQLSIYCCAVANDSAAALALMWE